ncbi:ABC transporter permease [Acutalibacter intestini]|uniref:ABC transporter permease n=1 Tax=Acutalibacter intestini TaxID=3093659 RepID=UPI002AC9A322|nr:ABC transporter permease subunit [Acutalibacter sp. M00204]
MESTKKQKGGKHSFRKHWQLYLFLLIPVIWLLVFKYYPMLGAQIAFRRFNPNGGIWGSPWVGWDNFLKFFASYQFPRVMKNTLINSFYSLAAGFPLPIILALMLNSLRRKRLRNTLETIVYIPHFISIVVLVGMMMQMMNPHIGVLGAVFRLFGMKAPDLFGSPTAFSHLYVWSGIWQNVGWNTIIYTAALSGVDPELHEAAQIDGASRFRRIMYIDFPAILATVTIMLIMNAGNIMSIGFEKVYLMQTDLNLSASEIISTYVYKVSFVQGSDFSYASAIGLFNSVINMALLVTVNTISSKAGENSLW